MTGWNDQGQAAGLKSLGAELIRDPGGWTATGGSP